MTDTDHQDDADGLTPKRLAFCDAIADGCNASDAYRLAYDAKNMAPATIHRKAAELMADGKIRARIAHLREALAEVAIWTRADSVSVLAEVARTAVDRPSARVAAVAALNKLLALDEQPDYIEQSPPQIIRIITHPAGASEDHPALTN